MSFQKTLADIPTPTVTGTARPSTAIAQAIGSIAQVAGQTVKDVQKNKLTEDIQQSADVATAISGAIEQKGNSVFDTSGNINTTGLTPDLQQQIQRVQANAGEKFSRIASAVRQGATTSAAAALETEAITRELINQTPGFSQEIKQLARELVGFDPTGYSLRKILDVDAPKSSRVTAQQKRLEEAQVMQAGLAKIGKNVEVDTILGNLALRDSLQLEKDTLDGKLSINTITLEQWAQKSFVDRGPDLADTILRVAQMGADGGITDNRQYVNAVIQQREADKMRFRQEVAARGGMEPTAMQTVESQIDAMYNPLINSINNNKLGDILADNIDLIAKTNALWGKKATPRLTKIIDAYGPQIGGQLLTMMSSIADPAQFELIYQFDPALKALIQGGAISQNDVADGVERVFDSAVAGEELSEENVQFRNITETLLTQPGNAASREAYVRGLGNSGAPVRAVSLLSTKVHRSQATQGEAKFMKDQFDVHVGTVATESIPGNLIDAIAQEIIRLNPEGVNGPLQSKAVSSRSTRQMLMGMSSKNTGQTKLFIPFDPTNQGGTLDFQTTSMKRLQPFLDAVTVKGYGVDLGVNKDTFVADVMTRINARIEKIRVEEIKTPKPKESLFSSIYNPSLVTGWALPENRMAFQNRETPDYEKDPKPKGTPIGVWQNNPLNIRKPNGRDWTWDGEVTTPDGHAAFEDASFGYRAAGMNLRIGFYRDRENTLTKIIKGPEDQPTKGWATGNQDNYIKYLVDELGIEADAKMSTAEFESQLPLIMKAMTGFEQGRDNPFTEDDINRGIELLGNRGKVGGSNE